MGSNIGNRLNISVFGESHGTAIGVTIDGLPAGERIDMEALLHFLSRRRPGSSLATGRKELDIPEFLSGVTDGVTNGFPVCAIIRNSDQHSSDYNNLRNNPRPSHADYTAALRYGEARDMRGGGHFSGRLTAPLCIAGGIGKQILERRGVRIGAHLQSVGAVSDERFPLHPDDETFNRLEALKIPVLNEDIIPLIETEIIDAKMTGDSIGGIIECMATGFPAGIGDPMFDGIENNLGKAIFGIPAVKGLEFGNGFQCASLKGSENNDQFILNNGRIETETNNHGGFLGGITSGMPIVFRAAIKPTPSISLPQKTINLETMEETTLEIKGRHDPCIALRAVPVMEAVTAITLLDSLL